jgi:hypothetical protein
MKKQIVIIIVVLVVLISASLYYIFKKNTPSADINGHKFRLELATSKDEKERGLGGRKDLCQECGMLFVFPREGIHPFWMKDMQFDLDIIWIKNEKIVYMAKNVTHDDRATVKPRDMADQVLEINAGLSDKYGLKEGDRVNFSL